MKIFVEIERRCLEEALLLLEIEGFVKDEAFGIRKKYGSEETVLVVGELRDEKLKAADATIGVIAIWPDIAFKPAEA
jgi:hypothetical protein